MGAVTILLFLYLRTYLPGGRSVDRRRLHFHIAVVVTETRIYKGPTPTSVCQRQFFRHHSQFQKEVPRKQHHPGIIVTRQSTWRLQLAL